MKPAVTVIIPTYNRARLVTRAIQSVLSQSCHDWELIVVDDASEDNTREAVCGLQDPRIHYLRHESKQGGSAARNTGIGKAQGDYVAFLDSDDEWLPTKLQRQLELFGRSSDQTGLTYTGAIHVYKSHSVRQFPRYKGALYRKLLLKNVIGGASTAMIRASALVSVNGFDETLPSRQDVDLWLRIAEHYRIDFVPECLVKIHNCDDIGRITLSDLKVLNGRLLFFYKHKEDMRKERVAHAYLRRLGRKFQNRRDINNARRWYIESIKENPLSPLSFLFFLLSLLPVPIYDAVKSFWQRVSDLSSDKRSQRRPRKCADR